VGWLGRDILGSVTDLPVYLRDQPGGSGPTCRLILGTLPQWFGIEQAVDRYVAVADRSPTVIASVGERDVGFLTVVRHSPSTAEIYVMGVVPEHHRQGVGRELLAHAERSLAAGGVEYLQVKTLSPSRPDVGYERTRAFYLANEFRPLEEFPSLWGPEDPALQMVKALRQPENPVLGSEEVAGARAVGRLLVLVTGMPGTGKSRVADAAGDLLGAAVLAHDWAMSGLRPYHELSRTLDNMDPPGHRAVGWSLLHALARSELRRDRPVVLDGVARDSDVAVCRQLVDEEGGRMLLLATECSDADLHRRRIEGSQRKIPGWDELDWERVARSRANWEMPGESDLTLDAARLWENNLVLLRDLLDKQSRGR
jgi:predicted kinase/GNAT superfamily N-acetyltransferase